MTRRTTTRLACWATAAALAASPAAAARPAEEGVEARNGLVVAADGRVEVKRQAWGRYAPARFGTTIGPDDLIRVGGGGRARILCPDLSPRDAEPGPYAPCPPAPGRPEIAVVPIEIRGSLLNDGRAAGDAAPLVVAPRRTRLLTARPMLRWTAVAGARSYKVTVSGLDAPWETFVRGATEVAYPADAPALVPGRTYQLVVAAGDDQPRQEVDAGVGFRVVDAAEAREVRAAEARVDRLAVDPQTRRLVRAHLFAGRGLTAEAIEALRGMAPSREPAVARMLGKLYLDTGLPAQAEVEFQAALRLSDAAGDTEGLAVDHDALARIFFEFKGNKAEALRHLAGALDAYKALGDERKVSEILARQKVAGP